MTASPAPGEHDVLTDLLTQVGYRNEKAFAELYRRTSARLFGLCMRMMGDPDDAEETLQECFVVVWHRAPLFDPRLAGAMTWLMAIARNKAIDRLRQRPRTQGARDIDWDALPDTSPGPAEDGENDLAYRRLSDCLGALEHRQRYCVRDAFFSGLTYVELAERMQVPLGTIKSWIRRALQQLRACMTP